MWTVCVVVVVVAYTPWSPELPSDLEDSDNRFTGRAKVELASSPYAGGEGAPCVAGRSGSSNVTRHFVPEGADSVIVFLRSFLSVLVTLREEGFSWSWLSSVEVFDRPGIFIRDFFFVGFSALISIVGAVVIISGAG